MTEPAALMPLSTEGVDITGVSVLDFGDSVISLRIFDLAIALAYACQVT